MDNTAPSIFDTFSFSDDSQPSVFKRGDAIVMKDRLTELVARLNNGETAWTEYMSPTGTHLQPNIKAYQTRLILLQGRSTSDIKSRMRFAARYLQLLRTFPQSTLAQMPALLLSMLLQLPQILVALISLNMVAPWTVATQESKHPSTI